MSEKLKLKVSSAQNGVTGGLESGAVTSLCDIILHHFVRLPFLAASVVTTIIIEFSIDLHSSLYNVLS